MGGKTRIDIPAGDVTLKAILHLPDRASAPVIVCCHGLLSLKDSPKYVEIGERMCAAGYRVLRFDFSGCGDSPPRPGRSLLGGRFEDLLSVIAFCKTQSWSKDRLGLLGSSLGGYLALMAADAVPDTVGAAVCWASPFDLSLIDPGTPGMEGLEELFPEGFRLGEPVTLSAARVACPTLLIHGRKDAVVDWRDALRIYDSLQGPAELIFMRSADHQFLDEALRRTAIDASLDWFKEHLPPDCETAY